MRIVFAGTPDFAAASLDALLQAGREVVAVYTQPDRPAGRGRKLVEGPVKRLATQHGLPVRQPESLKDRHQQAALASLVPDAMVVVAYGLILPREVLAIPRLGCLNVHASLLPRWRGAAPIQRALLAGDGETGVTIMQMAAGLDTGPMVLVRATPITEDDTAASLHDRLATLGAAALLEALDGLERGALQPVPQEDAAATYAHKLSKNEAWLDWNEDALALARRVRAFDPWPVAQTRLGEKTLRIWSAHPLPGEAEPGMVVAVDKQAITVGCGHGLLAVTRAQLPGGKPLSAAELASGRAFAAGVRLG